jgi:hypothetical protein
MDAFEKARSLIEEINRQRTQFIWSEVDAARMFLSIADTTRVPDTRRRNLENARKAHAATAKALSEGLSCSEGELARIEQELVAIGERLRRHGVLPK